MKKKQIHIGKSYIVRTKSGERLCTVINVETRNGWVCHNHESGRRLAIKDANDFLRSVPTVGIL